MARFSENWADRFLRLAEEVATWSKDPKGGVGAVLVDQRKRVIGLGFNGFPDRIPDDPALLNDQEAKLPRMIQAGVVAVYRRPHPEHRHRRWVESFQIAETILHEAGVETETVGSAPESRAVAAE